MWTYFKRILKMYVGIWNSKIKNHIQIRWAKNYELFTNVVIIETKARAKKGFNIFDIKRM
jgi:hypothetical protein